MNKEAILKRLDEIADIELFGELPANQYEKKCQLFADLYEEKCQLLRELDVINEQEELEKAEKKKERKAQTRRISKRWKSAEDWVCNYLNLKRWGHLRRGVSCPDGVNALFSVDVTSTRRKLSFLNKELDDARMHAEAGRIPVVVILQEGKRREDGIVVLRMKDWRDLHAGGE